MKALITGANSLLNEALLKRLVDMGYETVAHYHSENDITARLKQAFSDVKFVQADFDDEASFSKFLDKMIELAPFDIVVNGAVYYPEADDHVAAQSDRKTWQKAFAINVTSCGLILSQADKLVPKGVVVNMSSVNGVKHMGDIEYLIYSATKSALDSLTLTYAKVWTPNIRVVGIAPGQVKSAWTKDKSPQEIENILRNQMANKLIEPAEIADLMETMIKNPSINAVTYLIDGGYSVPLAK